MTKSPTSSTGLALDGIEIVELSDVDLDFAVEEAFREGAPAVPAATRTEPTTPDELAKLDLFRGVSAQDLAAIAARCQSIHAVPGYVLLAPGRLNTKIFFVVEGQLRLYARTGDKRPMAVADVGHSTGLRSALAAQPANHAVIATEVSHILAIDHIALKECVKRSHAFADNYAALLEGYLCGTNCLHVGGQTPGGMTQQGYVDPLTLLHNQSWLDTVFPRIVARYQLSGKRLAVVAFAIDRLDEIIKEHGIGPGLRVLEAISRWALEQTRPTDILAINKNRHVFAFLPECDLAAASQLAGRLKPLVSTLTISLAPGAAPDPVKITLSLGITELEPGMKENDFLNKTEALVQKSIKLGGNWLSEAL